MTRAHLAVLWRCLSGSPARRSSRALPMDPTRFDELTRVLLSGATGAGASRRRLLAVIATGGVGGFAAALHPDKAAAKNKKKKKSKCRGQTKRCGDKCIPDNACCLGRGRWVADGQPHNQCGFCTNGTMLVTLACDTFDPDGCTECNDDFQCVPVPEGTPCDCPDPEECCSCRGGLCESGCPGGQPCCGGKVCCDEDDGCCGNACCDPCPEERFCFGHGCCDEDEICCGLGNTIFGCCKPERCINDRCCLTVPCGPNVCRQQGEQCCFVSGTACAGDCCGDGSCCPTEDSNFRVCLHCGERWCCEEGDGCEGCTDPVPGRSS